MLRLTGGIFRGRSIRTPPSLRTRPTQAKLRQALFNSLQFSIPGAKVVDLFSGSGALGFEALSRGAESVCFVENAKSALACISENKASLKVEDRVNILTESVDKVVPRLLALAPFDLVLADPPYEAGWEMKLLSEWPWAELLSEKGLFCLEWGLQKSEVFELPEQVSCLYKVREKHYGDSVLTTYSKENDENKS